MIKFESLHLSESFYKLKRITANFYRNTVIKALLIILLAITAAAVTSPAVVTVFATYQANNGRKLPIYSVDVPDKKVSISFDAAWGDVC